MKLRESRNGFWLEDIRKEDIRFANLAGRMTGSVYDDPAKPQHVYILWIKEPELIEAFRTMGVDVKEVRNEETDEVRGYSVRFKAYPAKRQKRTGIGEEQYPVVFMKSTGGTVRLEEKSFGLVDSAIIVDGSIRFHLYEYDRKKPVIAVLDSEDEVAPF